MSAALRDAVRAREPRARVSAAAFIPFERRFGEPRLLASVIGVLGALALVLTIAGVYSVTSHAVAGRTAEIGIRMALGATSGGVKRMIMRETLVPAMIGVAPPTFGFMQSPNIPELLARAAAQGVPVPPMDTSYYLGRERLVLTGHAKMHPWRKRLFALMSRNARSATEFFQIPPNRVVELGAQIEF